MTIAMFFVDFEKKALVYKFLYSTLLNIRRGFNRHVNKSQKEEKKSLSVITAEYECGNEWRLLRLSRW